MKYLYWHISTCITGINIMVLIGVRCCWILFNHHFNVLLIGLLLFAFTTAQNADFPCAIDLCHKFLTLPESISHLVTNSVTLLEAQESWHDIDSETFALGTFSSKIHCMFGFHLNILGSQGVCCWDLQFPFPPNAVRSFPV